MKHQYVILKNEAKNHLVIREFAELDKDLMTLVCEESYDFKTLKAGLSNGPESLVSVLRTPNFFPAGIYAAKIAESVLSFMQSKTAEPIEIAFDDTEYLPKDRPKHEPEEELESETDEDIEDLMEDDFEEEFDDKDTIKKIDSAIKVADDDYEDFDEEN